VSAFYLFTLAQCPGVEREGIERVMDWIAGGRLKLVIGARLPLAQAAEAQRRVEARETTGKILLTVE
jgi:NADPH2:quinone reductase